MPRRPCFSHASGRYFLRFEPERQDIGLMQASTVDMFDEVDRQLTQLACAGEAEPAPAEPLPTVPAPPSAPAPTVVWLPPPPQDAGRTRAGIAIAAAVVALLG